MTVRRSGARNDRPADDDVHAETSESALRGARGTAFCFRHNYFVRHHHRERDAMQVPLLRRSVV
jgi:hypothetical protein